MGGLVSFTPGCEVLSAAAPTILRNDNQGARLRYYSLKQRLKEVGPGIDAGSEAESTEEMMFAEEM